MSGSVVTAFSVSIHQVLTVRWSLVTGDIGESKNQIDFTIIEFTFWRGETGVHNQQVQSSNGDKNLAVLEQGRYVGWRIVRRARWSKEMSLTVD